MTQISVGDTFENKQTGKRINMRFNSKHVRYTSSTMFSCPFLPWYSSCLFIFYGLARKGCGNAMITKKCHIWFQENFLLKKKI